MNEVCVRLGKIMIQTRINLNTYVSTILKICTFIILTFYDIYCILQQIKGFNSVI